MCEGCAWGPKLDCGVSYHITNTPVRHNEAYTCNYAGRHINTGSVEKEFQELEVIIILHSAPVLEGGGAGTTHDLTLTT